MYLCAWSFQLSHMAVFSKYRMSLACNAGDVLGHNCGLILVRKVLARDQINLLHPAWPTADVNESRNCVVATIATDSYRVDDLAMFLPAISVSWLDNTTTIPNAAVSTRR
jgi:hypothetical protein